MTIRLPTIFLTLRLSLLRFTNGYGGGGGGPNDGGGRDYDRFNRSMSNMDGPGDRMQFDQFGDRKMSNSGMSNGGMFNRQTSVPTNMDGMMHNGGGGGGGHSRNGFGNHDGYGGHNR